MGKIKLIIQREFTSRITKRSFWLITLFAPLIVTALVGFFAFISTQEQEKYDVLVIDPSSEFFGNFKFQSNSKIDFHFQANEISKETFKSSSFDLLLVFSKKLTQKHPVKLFYKKITPPSIESYIRKEVENRLEEVLVRSNPKIDSEEFYKLKRGTLSWQVYDIYQGDTEAEFQKRSYLGLALGFVILMFILFYSVQVMNGVVEEKNNKIVEIIISSVKPFQLMLGKIIGIGLVGITQFVLMNLLTLTALTILQSVFFPDLINPENISTLEEVSSNSLTFENHLQRSDLLSFLLNEINYPLVISMFIFYFIGGFLLYGSLFAAIGAMVDQDTETSQFTLPLTFPLTFGVIIGRVAILNPDGPSAMWFSLFPFTSPIVVMQRLPMGIPASQFWQLIVSMILLIGTFLFTTWIAGKIYKTGILLTGKKVKLKDVWKWIFANY